MLASVPWPKTCVLALSRYGGSSSSRISVGLSPMISFHFFWSTAFGPLAQYGLMASASPSCVAMSPQM